MSAIAYEAYPNRFLTGRDDKGQWQFYRSVGRLDPHQNGGEVRVKWAPKAMLNTASMLRSLEHDTDWRTDAGSTPESLAHYIYAEVLAVAGRTHGNPGTTNWIAQAIRDRLPFEQDDFGGLRFVKFFQLYLSLTLAWHTRQKGVRTNRLALQKALAAFAVLAGDLDGDTAAETWFDPRSDADLQAACARYGLDFAAADITIDDTVQTFPFVD